MPLAAKDPKLPPPVAIPDGQGWTQALQVLSSDSGETLVIILRTLYPHDGLDDRIYRRVVLQYDRLSASPGVAALIAEAIAALDGRLPLPFRECSESYRVAALKAIEATPAFTLLQRTGVRFLYDDIEVWEAFGYEGASTHLGGYINRGFNDLDWLPEPPVGGVTA